MQTLNISKAKIQFIFENLKQNNPNPECELVHSNNFELLIAVLLSAQATDISVNKATVKLFDKASSPKEMLALGEIKINNLIKTIGLHRNKTAHIIKTCEILINQYQSIVPNSRQALESLPGVGRKTANVILNVAFKQNTIAVDTHVARVSNRLGLSTAKTPLKIELELIKIIPKQYIYHAHLWLILHGRYICKAKKPDCNNCYLNKLCRYYETQL